MSVRLHPHARDRLVQRGATEAEVIATIERGERVPGKFGRTAFRRNFGYNAEWRGQFYATKQLEVIAVKEGQDWVAITVLVKFF